jgi:hypothetical protein
MTFVRPEHAFQVIAIVDYDIAKDYDNGDDPNNVQLVEAIIEKLVQHGYVVRK